MSKTNIYVIGYPKSGTTWLCRLLGDVLNSPVGAAYKPSSPKCIAAEGENRTGKYYIGQGHQLPVFSDVDKCVLNSTQINMKKLEDNKIVFITRNWKDIIVSVKHHWNIPTIEETIKKVFSGTWPLTHGGGIPKFYEKWNKIYANEDYISNLYRISYELLYADTRHYLTKILQYFNFDTEQSIVEVCKRQSIESRRQIASDKLNYGREFQLKFLRKGIVDDWENHFTSSDLELYERLRDERLNEK